MHKLIKDFRNKFFPQWVILGLLLVVLLFGVYFFVNNFEVLRREGFIHRPPGSREISPEQIRGWMTFRYINMIFRLPPEYLQTELNIQSSHYPNLSLSSVAKQEKISLNALLQKTTEAVKNYGK